MNTAEERITAALSVLNEAINDRDGNDPQLLPAAVLQPLAQRAIWRC